MTPSTDWCWVPELGRWGLDFDGSNDYVDCAGPNLHSRLTFAFWINPLNTDTSNYKQILDSQQTLGTQNDQYGCYSYNNKPTVYFAGHRQSTSTMSLGAWQHVAATYTPGVLTWFRNGVPDGVISCTQPTKTTFYLRIGARNATTYQLNGGLSDIVLYSRDLSLPEIQTLANPADPMLGGLVLPPKRKLYAIRSTAYSRRYFSLQTSIGAFALQT